MKASKGSLFFAITLLLVLSDRVFAGQTSLLDPYADVQAPHASTKSKGHKQASAKEDEEKAAAAKKKAASESVLTEFDNAPAGSEAKQKASKPAKEKPEPKLVDKPLAKEKPLAKDKPVAKDKPIASKDSGQGVVSGIKDMQSGYVKAIKAAGNGIVNGTRAAGGKVADGTKKMRDGVTSGARSSGQCFLQGARAIGNGFKATGNKVKQGADSVGGKIASGPKPKHTPSPVVKDDKTAAVDKGVPGAESEKVLDDSSIPGKPLEPLATKPLVKSKTIKTASQKQGVMGRTFGKFNIFSRGSKQGAQIKAQPQQTVSDLRQVFPN